MTGPSRARPGKPATATRRASSNSTVGRPAATLGGGPTLAFLGVRSEQNAVDGGGEGATPVTATFTLREAAEELVRRCFSTSAVAPSSSAFERE